MLFKGRLKRHFFEKPVYNHSCHDDIIYGCGGLYRYPWVVYSQKQELVNMGIHQVVLSRKVQKCLVKLPKYIILKLMAWIEAVGYSGLRMVKKTPGYHDEPLFGKRLGQRSIRLSKKYRAIYRVDKSGEVHFVEVIEVNNHKY